ncbi:hypothetical protein EMCRGX_G010299 [Ephydatia muelleri]
MSISTAASMLSVNNQNFEPQPQPWTMIAVDVLEVLRSVNNNIYLLMIQDYFTKWVEAIPLPDQTANRITTETICLFAVYGIFCTQTKGHLQAKLAELQDFVEANTVQAGAAQKTTFDSHAKLRLFKEGDTVWLSVPKYSKLGSKWEGKWIIKSVKNAINMEITDGTRKRIFPINRLQHRNQRQCDEVPPKDHPTIDVWNAPQMNHIITSPDLPREDLPEEQR